jgi:hypothetical protein
MLRLVRKRGEVQVGSAEQATTSCAIHQIIASIIALSSLNTLNC